MFESSGWVLVMVGTGEEQVTGVAVVVVIPKVIVFVS